MNKMIRKFWGVALVVVLLATLFVAAVPTASAGNLRWTVQGTPDTFGITNQVLFGSDVSFVTVAPNGDIFAVDTAGAVTGNDVIYKSTTGGLTWTGTGLTAPTAPWGANPIVGLAISPSYATDHTVLVVTGVAGASQVYISSNSGASFAVLGGTIPATATSIAIAPNYNAGGEIMVGAQLPAIGAFGDVYFWGLNGTLNWTTTAAFYTAAALAVDVVDVAYSPNYAIDGTRLAFGADATPQEALHSLIGADATWDLTLAAFPVVNAGTGTGNANPIVSGTIALPSDFNGSLPTARTCYVASVTTGINDNVYRVTVGTAVPGVALNPSAVIGGGPDYTTASLAFNGTSAGGTLFAGDLASTQVYSVSGAAALTANAIIAPMWGFSLTAPSGAAGTTYIALAADYATSSKIYAGTAGAGDETAFSISDNGGLGFYQAGLIDTGTGILLNNLSISDFQVVNATTFFMVTFDGVNTISLWKTTNTGAAWYRVLAYAGGARPGIVRPSPNFATDSTVYFGDVTGVGIRYSNDGGNTWTARVSPVAITDMVVKDQYTLYVGGGTVVQGTANGGWIWNPPMTTGAAALNDLKLNVATGDMLVGGNAGDVYLLASGAPAWVPVGPPGIGAGLVAVTFDAGYATNKMIYAADTSTAAGDVFRFANDGSYLAWLALASGVPTGAGLVGDILAAPDGTLYATDTSVGAGFARTVNPMAGTDVVCATGWNAAATAGTTGGLPAAAALSLMARAEGSNVIYAADTTAAASVVYVFSDSISGSTTSPVPTAPAVGAIVDSSANPVVFMWDAVAGATAYNIRWDTRPDFLTATVRGNVLAPATMDVVLAGIPAGMTIYWQVRVATPLVGPYCASQSFITQMAVAAINAPNVGAGFNAVEGGVGAGGWNASVTPTFSWSSILGATAYEFQLSKNADFSVTADIIVDATGANALGAVTSYKPAGTLDFNTSYFWRVRGISATTNTDWTAVIAFTTKAAPTTSTPQVTITQPPATTIILTQTQPPVTTQVVEENVVNPTYIWAIIIIGAVLVIAVIVLIVRTRRSV